MRYSVISTGRFKSDLKTAIKRRYNIELLDEIVGLLSEGKSLPERNKDHLLKGKWIGHRECHIAQDWLLVYKIERDILVLTLTRTGTGTHSDLEL